ncbi:MAG: GrpB family protein, partial [bacterium]|nr:GrpB family protein [bacterium]
MPSSARRDGQTSPDTRRRFPGNPPHVSYPPSHGASSCCADSPRSVRPCLRCPFVGSPCCRRLPSKNTTRRFYRKGKPRSRHIHIVERGSKPHLDHVNFRDALLSNENLRQEYLRLKQDAMGEFKHRRALYGEKKGAL